MKSKTELPLSLEFFPPKTPEGAEKLGAVRRALYAIKPQFCSVTYGAGGSTQEGTWATVQAIRADGVEGVPHFSCLGTTKADARQTLAQFKEAGITRIVALRGDLPSGYGAYGEFRYGSELVEFIRAETGSHFHIEVAAYPETHPQAKNPQADLLAFAIKAKAGASSAITQYFYNTDAYFRFVDDAHKLGVDLPIVPGIMPITNSSQLIRFSEACGAEIPRWVRRRLEAFGDDSASIRAFGLDVVTDLVDQLRTAGVPGIHFYAMNQSAPVLEICKRLELA